MKIAMDKIIVAASMLVNVICVCTLGDYVIKQKKMSDALDKLGDKIDIHVDDEMINSFVAGYVEKEMHSLVDTAMRASLTMHRGAIRDEVSSAVAVCKKDISKDVEEEIRKQVGSLSISSIKKEALKEAKEAAIEQLKDDLEDILENYKENLENFSVMYSAVAEKEKKPASTMYTFDFGNIGL